jgi:hypothetical protein
MLRAMRRRVLSATVLAIGVLCALGACSSGGSNGDAGAEAGNDAANGDANNGNDTSTCTTTLCVQNNTSNLCPSCSPTNGDICSPPAAITCNYTNGCSGAQLQSSQCTCELPDASSDGGDAGDAGSPVAIWSCQ